jgi:hypothetical protein
LVGKPGRKLLKDLGVDGRITLRWIFKTNRLKYRAVDLPGSG